MCHVGPISSLNFVRDEAACEPRSLVDSVVHPLRFGRLCVISCIIIALTRHSLGLLSHAHSLINVVSALISLVLPCTSVSSVSV